MYKLLFCFTFIFGLYGCAQTVETRLDNLRENYMQSTDSKFNDNYEKLSNLELLITADSLFHKNKFLDSDAAYSEFNNRNIKLNGTSILREAGGVLGGSLLNDYRPYMMDNLFVSYYQIWNALADGRYDDARVFINQSYAKQQEMSLEYKRLIESNQNDASKNSGVSKMLEDENLQWHAFRDIMNPALTYLAGIYFLHDGDFENAETYLRRVAGMAPDNTFVKMDLKLSEKQQLPNSINWVFIEDGFAPKLREKRIHVPVNSGNEPIFVTLATSEPHFTPDSKKIKDSELIADVDAMFMTEYSQYRINEAIRAFSSMIAKTALQTSIYKSDSKYAGLFGLIGGLYSIVSTNAEVRTWATLPKNISIIRLDNNGLIELKSDSKIIKQIKTPTDGNNLIYVRLGGKNIDYKVINLK